jgi:hypothetical protein
VTAAQAEDKSIPKERLIMTAGSHNRVAKVLQAPELSGEVERAVWQVEHQLKKEDQHRAQAAGIEAPKDREK